MVEKKTAMSQTERMAKSGGWRLIKERAESKGMTVYDDVKVIVEGSKVRYAQWDGAQWVYIEIPETKKIRSTDD